MKTIEIKRTTDNGKSTIGQLKIDHIEMVTMEDTFREEKIKGETRIPSGNYEVKLRKIGGHHKRYSQKFPFHKGMLQIMDVPNFTNILIHIGNTNKDTSGCVLTGKYIVNGDRIGNSTGAYIELYKHLLPFFEDGEEVRINIIDN